MKNIHEGSDGYYLSFIHHLWKKERKKIGDEEFVHKWMNVEKRKWWEWMVIMKWKEKKDEKV